MTRHLAFCAASLFAASANAAESQAEAPAEPAPTPEPAPVAEPPAPIVSTAPVTVLDQVPPSAEAAAPAPAAATPYTGWGRGLRAPIYVNFMLFAGGLAEDGDNRLTTRDSKLLEGFGALFRVGAVLAPHHRLGGRLQSFVRPTKKVALDPGSTAATTDDWGAVTYAFVGPEYLYTTDLGIYGAASAGVGFAASSRDVDEGDDDDDHDTEKASAGISGMLSLGYEWRANKWFAMNVEAFGGLYHGVDDNEDSMNGALFGLAMGLGF